MISAFQHRKYSIERKEDAFTSLFFDTLFLLPGDMIWGIIHKSCYDNKTLPQNAGALLRAETQFWPSWDARGTKNARRVEPDLLIRFEEIDVIIEAKQEYNRQQEGQWRNEYTSYCNEADGELKDVILIAIDGITNTGSEEIRLNRNKTFRVVKTKWRALYETVAAEHHNQKRKDDSQISLILRLLKDYCEYWGLAKTVWPHDVFTEDFVKITRIDRFDISKKMLRDIANRYTEDDVQEEQEHIGFNNMLNNEYTEGFSAGMKTLTKMEANYE